MYSRIKETEMKMKQTEARAHVGVCSREGPDVSPPAMACL
jgi:hypothetical protein